MDLMNENLQLPEGLGFRLALDMRAMTNLQTFQEIKGKGWLITSKARHRERMQKDGYPRWSTVFKAGIILIPSVSMLDLRAILLNIMH